MNANAQRVAEVVEKFVDKVGELLKDEPKANYVLLRGFSQKPKMRSFEERFGLKACAIAVYPMYRGSPAWWEWML